MAPPAVTSRTVCFGGVVMIAGKVLGREDSWITSQGAAYMGRCSWQHRGRISSTPAQALRFSASVPRPPESLQRRTTPRRSGGSARATARACARATPGNVLRLVPEPHALWSSAAPWKAAGCRSSARWTLADLAGRAWGPAL